MGLRILNHSHGINVMILMLLICCYGTIVIEMLL